MHSSQPTTENALCITSPPFAEGRERHCYLHPQDPTKVIKIPKGSETIQTRRELVFFRNLEKRAFRDYSHLPRFYGTVETNLGQGLVTELIRDHDGQISRSLNWHIENGLTRGEVEAHFRRLKQYLLDNLVIFNHDLTSGNMLLRMAADDSAKLVIIDGLGDVVAISWFNRIPTHVRAKIERRWNRLITRFYQHHFVDEQRNQKL